MAAEDIRSVLEELAAGNTTVDAALLALRKEPFSDLGYAKVDHHREMRQGAAEVIYGASKTYDQIKGISQSLLDNGQTCILITRVSAESAALLAADFAEVGFTYHEIPQLAIVGTLPKPTGNGTIVVAAAGTSDLAVSEEAALTAEALGNKVASFGGVAALLAMLNSCASGVSVVNIDNGFGAGFQAHLINHLEAKKPDKPEH